MKTIKTLLQSFEDYSSKFTNQELYAFTEGGTEPSLIKWNPSVSEDELNQFIKKNGWYFPSDLREFYLLHNGGVLFQHPYYGGGINIYTLEDIQGISNDSKKLPKHWYPIARADLTTGDICIDSERCRSGQYPYIFFLGSINRLDEAIPIHTDFTTWLTRLFICQGEEYWVWDYRNKLRFKSSNK
ncbi:SMI1/KNR4 family protein [Paenibacillus alvei]|uniref:SMI1/KNR4 family protein n=1 Tax=Paenibacillus alvei TaxID=44250 RepID=UPI0018CEBB6B|nr:SMI1/KNR4 family protein [Paenibacillus alvei]MCY9581890.1 SMI1/KNR4 family protein [Paenibacillus alvei]MCY9586776.1 SMI1/KNR4 family protein [Paenibacillus alvei]